MLLVLLLVVVFSLPSVQTKLAGRLTSYLNQTYNTQINIDRLGLNWKGNIDLRDLYIKDHHQDTLIYAGQLQTSILSFSNLLKTDVSLGYVTLSDTKLFIKTYKNEARDNMSVFSGKFNSGTKAASIFKLSADDVFINSSAIKITDQNLSTPLLFYLTGVEASAKDFEIDGPDVLATITSLALTSKRGFEITGLNSQFSYTTEQMTLKNMELETSQSILKGDVVMNYSTNGYSDFVNTVVFTASFTPSSIATNDLNGFYNEFGSNQTIDFKGNFKGVLNDFSFTKAAIATSNTKLAGDYYFKDVLKGATAFNINFRRHDITTSYYDLRRFLPNILGKVLPEELSKLGVFDYDGSSQINSNTFTTDAIFKSDIGVATTSLSIDNYKDVAQASYKGNIILSSFDIGALTKEPSLGEVSANVSIDGRGFTQKTVDTGLSGVISSFSFQGYDYKNITLQGALKDPVFNGDLSIDDPNVQLDFKGLVDVSKSFNQFDFQADVHFAELNQLQLVSRDSVSVFAGKVVVDMDGTTIDDIVGSFSFQQTFYQNQDDDFYFDDFKIASSFEDQKRIIDINSPDICNGTISGNFLIKDISNLFRIWVLGSMYANYIPREVTTNQYIDYDLSVYSKIVEVFVPELQVGENSRLRGSVSSDESKFQLDFKYSRTLIVQ